MTTISSENKSHSKTKKPVRIGMLSLGCPKTLVDSENILGKLTDRRFRLTASVADCDIALLNTCAFIQDAKDESIDRILELIELKKEKRIRALVVMGCFVQRYPNEMRKEFAEVDAFIGSGEYDKIPQIVDKVLGGEEVFDVKTPGYLATSNEARIALTPPHYRYLKISEGCDHICTFCAIPSFRGKHRSRPLPDLVREARELVDQGAKEIIITGQDTTYYGRDLSGEFMLPELIGSLDKIKGLEWLRLLYAYPSCITEDLMNAMRTSAPMCHYLDMPLQHASDNMLTAMKRGITQRRTYDLIEKFRRIVPDLAIRTTFIVGFPGETDKDFKELLAFIREMKFERLGIFQYSHEDGTPSFGLKDQVPEKIKKERFEEAMLLQQSIAEANNQKLMGKKLRVLIDAKDDSKKGLWLARSYMDAPEVDGNVLIKTTQSLNPGDFVPVTITSTQAYDLVGKIT